MPPRLLLASTSPRRSDLLNQLGLTFDVQAPDFEEVMDASVAPGPHAADLALGKASSVAVHHPHDVVIGADTFIAFNGDIIGKPKSPEDAIATLKQLRNNINTVYTGWAVVHNGQQRTGWVATDVHMADIPDDDIERYVATGEPLDKAGSYAVNGKAAVFIERIEGSIDATIGLPLRPVAEALRSFGIEVLP